MRIGTAVCLLLSVGWIAGLSAQALEEISVFAGSSPRDNCPVVVDIPFDETLPDGTLRLVKGDEVLPCMILRESDADRKLAFIVNGLKPYEKRTFLLETGEAASTHPVEIEDKNNTLEILIGGNLFTRYIYYIDTLPRPIFYPLLGPSGVQMTRGYPMDPHEGESTDHEHHHSLWVSHGDVNKVDFWMAKPDGGKQRHRSFSVLSKGPVCGEFVEGVEWVDANEKPVLFETRKVVVWGLPESGRIIDFDLTFVARYEDVTFGDTKEGGFLSLRVAQTLNEKQAEGTTGGVITNANNQTGMKNAWGQPAAWCDYSGPVVGGTAGLAIMDHPQNIFFPTNYHVRDYGLFTANPFGLSDFYGDEKLNGARTLKKGETWRLQYRLFVHAGDVQSGGVAQAYDNYTQGLQVILR